MQGQTTPKEFFEYLKDAFPSQDSRDIDPSTLKYVIYARKSTKGEERQERSIPDQIDDCMKREVIPTPLHVVGPPIREDCSAKEPDIRPKFRQMLDDIKAGKYDGIVAWHPDRLARNMKEAGEIIDLLDKGVLKDLRFATSSFENSPTGKMLLGISFVLSKQYSEHLSESVTRGNRKKTEAGFYFGKMKHGYYISDDEKLYPDGNNFILIKKAFIKRLEGWSQLEIAKWLNTQGYTLRKKGKGPQNYTWDKDNVSLLLKDTVYTGVLRYGKTFVDLTELYEFEPILSVDDFLKINKVKDLGDPRLISSIMVKPRDAIKANLLRGIVHCGYCLKPFTSSVTPKPLKSGVRNYYYFRCETSDCSFRGKSVRGKVIINYATEFLSEHLFTTENNYERYVAEAREYATIQAKALDGDIAGLTRHVGNKQDEYNRTKITIRDNPGLTKHYNLDEIESELKDIKKDLRKLTATRKRLKQSILTYKQYLELFETIGVNLRKTHDMTVLDQTLRKFFLNFTIKDHAVSVAELTEPWATFVKTGNFDRGRGDRT
jgi:DNA invertase Pin-like site-specific DNA recombinase